MPKVLLMTITNSKSTKHLQKKEELTLRSNNCSQLSKESQIKNQLGLKLESSQSQLIQLNWYTTATQKKLFHQLKDLRQSMKRNAEDAHAETVRKKFSLIWNILTEIAIPKKLLSKPKINKFGLKEKLLIEKMLLLLKMNITLHFHNLLSNKCLFWNKTSNNKKPGKKNNSKLNCKNHKLCKLKLCSLFIWKLSSNTKKLLWPLNKELSKSVSISE